MHMPEYTFIIIGGGVAGITCAETLEALNPSFKILILTYSPSIKICNNVKITPRVESFEVEEEPIAAYLRDHPNFDVIVEQIQLVDAESQQVHTLKDVYHYKSALCIATGSYPSIICCNRSLADYIYTLRDTDSVDKLKERLSHSKCVMIVGNGGIASELVFKIKNCKIIWVIKDENIIKKFLSEGASEYIMQNLSLKYSSSQNPTTSLISQSQNISSIMVENKTIGSAVGPNWHLNYELAGNIESKNKDVLIFNKTQIVSIKYLNVEYIEVTLSNGHVFECNLIISATGVKPNSEPIKCTPQLKLCVDDSNAILVDKYMRTSVDRIYAAGDVCAIHHSQWAPNWFPMRLWDQAYHMGYLAAQNMAALDACPETPSNFEDFYFELFTHTTHFFGKRVILLGLYNPTLPLTNAKYLGIDRLAGIEFQRLLSIESDHYIELILSPSRDNSKVESSLVKTVEFEEIIQSLVKEHPMYVRGAIMIGNTDLVETIENLILNQIDVSRFGDDLLNPNIDIDDYFD